jgi:hypothetical protein
MVAENEKEKEREEESRNGMEDIQREASASLCGTGRTPSNLFKNEGSAVKCMRDCQ